MAQSAFSEKVYKITSQIPRGSVATYKQIAKLAGSENASRAVGMLMKKNHNAPIVPCHRVVASNGKLTGYSAEGGVVKKRKMLIEEGVVFKGEIVDLEKSMWKK